ncbi:DJ-1/PfpI family protein [Xylariaceae sp. FL0016]|nr:DJ-1/PfpI family protein [Xylariaceae sp. FL0016]
MLLQDMIGVVDPLQLLANNFHMNLYIISETLEPVTTEPASATMNPYNSSFWPKIVPTHTFANAPDDIEVLVVPGGPGIRAPDVSAITDFIADTYPKLRYLFTICTGAGLAAKAGVLDGRRATTNKHAWDTIRAMGPDVEWVSPARWVVDGNIWSSSSVSCRLGNLHALGSLDRNLLTQSCVQGTAGLDLTFAWINSTFGPEWADKASGIMEYMPNAQDFDPFAAKYNVTPTGW